MQRVKLGKSGLSVSPVAFGTWQLSSRFWGDQPKDQVVAAMKAAFDLGINFFDTADAYSFRSAAWIGGHATARLKASSAASGRSVSR